MIRKYLFAALAAILLALVCTSEVRAWGCYHAGYTHVGYGGVYHVGRTGVYGGYGGAYRYGGYHPYGYGGAYRYGYYRRW